MRNIKTIQDLKEFYQKNKEIYNEAKNILKKIDNYSKEELEIFNKLIEVLFNDYTNKYTERPDGTIFKIADTIQSFSEDINVNLITENVINYIALYENQYHQYITNCLLSAYVRWIQRLLNK